MNFLTLLFAFFATYRITEANYVRLDSYPQCLGSSPNCFYECPSGLDRCDAVLIWSHAPGHNYVQFNISWWDEFPQFGPLWVGFGFANEYQADNFLHYVCLAKGGSVAPLERFVTVSNYDRPFVQGYHREVGIEPVSTLTNGVQTVGARTEMGQVTSCVFNVYANRRVGDVNFDLSAPTHFFFTFSNARSSTFININKAYKREDSSNRTTFSGIAPPLAVSAEIPQASLATGNFPQCNGTSRNCRDFECDLLDENCQVILFWSHTPGNNYVQFNISWYDAYPREKWGAVGTRVYGDNDINTIFYICPGTPDSVPTEYFKGRYGSIVRIESVTGLTNGVETLASRSESGGVTSCVFNVYANRVVEGVQFDLSTFVGVVALAGPVTDIGMLYSYSLGSLTVQLFPYSITTTEVESITTFTTVSAKSVVETTTFTTVTAKATQNVVSISSLILNIAFAANFW